MDAVPYPGPEDVGRTGDWDLPLDNGRLVFHGTFLGMSTTYQDAHTHPGDFVPEGRKCQGCRWFEPRIFAQDSVKNKFLIYTVGASDVPGETDRCRVRYGDDAWQAVHAMSAHLHANSTERVLSFVARRAIEQAALREPDFRKALGDWDARTTRAGGR